MNKIDALTIFLHAIVISNIPLLYGTIGEIMVEKSGSLNLGVEGIMAVGAMFGYIIGCQANSMLVGILVAFGTAALCGLLFALLTITFQANQNITGLTLTTFGLGVYNFVGNNVNANGWTMMSEVDSLVNGWKDIKIPLLGDIPILGHGLFNHNIFVYLGIALAVGMWFYLNKTRPGLRLQAISENPGAADSVGINVNLYKYLHICIGCGIMGIGGYYMGLYLGGFFSGDATWINGYGWIAVALVIFANWSPAIAILGTFIFGFFNTLQVSGSTLALAFPTVLGWLGPLPKHLYQALPFLITAIVLVVTSIRQKRGSGAPAALGTNYFREER